MVNEHLAESVRNDFPALNQQRNGKPPIYFDNACTTLVPGTVIDAMDQYYLGFPGCGGWRGRYWFAAEVNRYIEGDSKQAGSRRKVQDFIHAASPKEIIFTYNTSHAINMVALGFQFKPGDVVLLGDKEHNSNLLPWLRLQKKGLIKVDHVDSDPEGDFDLASYERKLRSSPVKLVSLALTSNLTGQTLPAKEIIHIAHAHGARVLLDGAQTIPHKTIDVRDLDVDFLAFSIHKMCGPRGVGVLYGKREWLGSKFHEEDEPEEVIEPAILGGGTVNDTTYDSYGLLEPPERFEVGVQNYSGQIGAGAAVDYIKKIGMDNISAWETRLNKFLTEKLMEQYGDAGWFKILGPADPAQRGGILTFDVHRPNAVGIAEELDERSNIMIRYGVFCVHSYLNKMFGNKWTEPRLPSEHHMTYRVSLYFYNTIEECEIFLKTLNDIFTERAYI